MIVVDSMSMTSKTLPEGRFLWFEEFTTTLINVLHDMRFSLSNTIFERVLEYDLVVTLKELEYIVEITLRDVVLRDGDRRFEVECRVPPLTWNEDHLARLLVALDRTQVATLVVVVEEPLGD